MIHVLLISQHGALEGIACMDIYHDFQEHVMYFLETCSARMGLCTWASLSVVRDRCMVMYNVPSLMKFCPLSILM